MKIFFKKNRVYVISTILFRYRYFGDEYLYVGMMLRIYYGI